MLFYIVVILRLTCIALHVLQLIGPIIKEIRYRKRRRTQGDYRGFRVIQNKNQPCCFIKKSQQGEDQNLVISLGTKIKLNPG